MASRWGAREAALEQALEHARRAGDRREEADILGSLGLTLYWGPTPADEAIVRCRELLAKSNGDRVLRARIQAVLAGLSAMQGRFDEARDYYAQSKSILSELGLKVLLAVHTLAGGTTELLADEPARAEKELRWGFDLLDEMGATRPLATVAPVLAQAVYAQGRLDEAEELTHASEEAAAPDDIASQVLWRTVRAKVAAGGGAGDDAEELAREAVELAAPTDSTNLYADALLSLAEVLGALGKQHEARDAASTALALYTAKGNVISAAVAGALVSDAAPARAPG
jgi:ATP/maltotriose-dependent transcriptional regulator MalT